MSASWYNTNWKYRWPLSLDISAVAAGTYDFTIALPSDFDLFWNNVLSSGNDIRVTQADGVTLCTYDIAAGFSTTTRSGTIEIDNLVSSVGSTVQLAWLYWGYASATDARTAFAPASAKTGYVCLDQPHPDRTVRATPERAGSTIPSQAIHKSNEDQIDVYFRLSELLVKRSRVYNESVLYESISEASYQVTLGKANQAGMVEASKSRFGLDADGSLFFRCRVKSGGDGTDYACEPKLYSTVDSRIYNPRALIRVNDVNES